MITAQQEAEKLILLSRDARIFCALVDGGMSLTEDVDFNIRILAELFMKIKLAFPNILDEEYGMYYDQSINSFKTELESIK